MQLSHKVFHARHLLFNLKQETGRECYLHPHHLLLRKARNSLGLTPPVLLKSIRDFGIEGEPSPTRASFETIPSLYDRQEHHQGPTNTYNRDLP